MSRFKLILLAAGLAFCPLKAKAAQAPVDQIVEHTKKDIDEIARVVMSEANAEPTVGQVAVVACIFNRARIFDMSIHEVIHSPNQFSSHWQGKVSEECYDAVTMYLQCPTLFPDDLVYFQQHSFPRWGEDYLQIGAHYFSTYKTKTEIGEEERNKCFFVYETMELQAQ